MGVMAAPLSHEQVMIAEALGEQSIPRLLGEELIAAAREVVAIYPDIAIISRNMRENRARRRFVRAIDRLEELVGKP
jgi:hypothetical protein